MKQIQSEVSQTNYTVDRHLMIPDNSHMEEKNLVLFSFVFRYIHALDKSKLHTKQSKSEILKGAELRNIVLSPKIKEKNHSLFYSLVLNIVRAPKESKLHTK